MNETCTPAELMVEARTRLLEGKLPEAQALLEHVAARWREEGNAAEEARCLRLAASLSRHQGQLGEAGVRASLAATIAPERSPAAVAAQAELARIALAERNAQAAVDACERALAEGAETGELLELYAEALAAAGRPGDAAGASRRARDALASAGDPWPARALVRGASVLQAAGSPLEAAALMVEAEQAAAEAEDHEALADLALLASTRALDAKDLPGARREAERARAEALAARSPGTYFGAAVALAEMADAAGDRVDAYASLAKGWATLGDLLGREAARAVFEPQLLRLRARWGVEAFEEAKAGYEELRRRQIAQEEVL